MGNESQKLEHLRDSALLADAAYNRGADDTAGKPQEYNFSDEVTERFQNEEKYV